MVRPRSPLFQASKSDLASAWQPAWVALLATLLVSPGAIAADGDGSADVPTKPLKVRSAEAAARSKAPARPSIEDRLPRTVTGDVFGDAAPAVPAEKSRKTTAAAVEAVDPVEFDDAPLPSERPAGERARTERNRADRAAADPFAADPLPTERPAKTAASRGATAKPALGSKAKTLKPTMSPAEAPAETFELEVPTPPAATPKPRNAPPAAIDKDFVSEEATRLAPRAIEQKVFADQVPSAERIPPKHRTEPSVKRTREITTVPVSAVTRGGVTVIENGPQLASLTLEWVKQGELHVGQEGALELVVRNPGSLPANKVSVEAYFPTTVRLTAAQPEPVGSGEKAVWNFESIGPGLEQRIAIKLIPNRRGDLGLNAAVRFTGASVASFRVDEPLLKVAIKGPSEVMVGDPAPFLLTVFNPGTGVTQDVRLEAVLSAGLEHPKGDRVLIDIGSLNPGETRAVRLAPTAMKGGAQSIAVSATSSSDTSHSATAELAVTAPSLKLVAEGPGLRYKGRNARFHFTVTNDGTVANNNVRVIQLVPEGFRFLAADKGGKYDSTNKSILWFVGRLEPGQTAHVSCDLTANALGEFAQMVTASADGGVHAEARVDTQVDGIAALILEVVDLDDPVEVGVETGYEVRLKNDGSQAATNVQISCELPAGVEYVDAEGPAEASLDGRTVRFRTLGQLAPGQQTTYRVLVRGIQDGTQRFRARVVSDANQEPIVLEEQTKFYSDARR